MNVRGPVAATAGPHSRFPESCDVRPVQEIKRVKMAVLALEKEGDKIEHMYIHRAHCI